MHTTEPEGSTSVKLTVTVKLFKLVKDFLI